MEIWLFNHFHWKGPIMMTRIMIVMSLVGRFCWIDTAAAQTAKWMNGEAETAPSGWSITPRNPSSSDVIHFSGPIDGVYGDTFSAEAHFRGKPDYRLVRQRTL